MLTRERIEEALTEAVDRGRMTTADAQTLATGLLDRGRKQTNEVMKDLEGLLSRGRYEVEGRTSACARRPAAPWERRAARRRARAAVPCAQRRGRSPRPIAPGARPGWGRTSRSPRYDDLTADQVVSRLTTLTPAELRKVRDYERRNANRKTVLNSIESKLG